MMNSQMPWRYEIKSGPDDEASHAWIYDDNGEFIAVMKIHKAKQIVDAMNARSLSSPDHADAVPSAGRAAVLEEAAKIAEDYVQYDVADAIRLLALHPVADKPSDDGAQGEEWQTIESAPKDGTVVLAFCKDEGVVSVRFEQKHSYGRFLVCGVSDSYYGEFGVYPTHWRPLPSAPASEGAE